MFENISIAFQCVGAENMGLEMSLFGLGPEAVATVVFHFQHQKLRPRTTTNSDSKIFVHQNTPARKTDVLDCIDATIRPLTAHTTRPAVPPLRLEALAVDIDIDPSR